MKRLPNETSSPVFTYEKDQEPIILPKATMDLFLQSENPAPLIGLYCFYYYTAKWQGTNQPKATTKYTARGLQWSADTVRKYKKELIEYGLITDVTVRDAKKKITGHYIKVNFIWSQDRMMQSHPQEFSRGGKFPGQGKTQARKNSEGNALNSNRLNALNSIITNALNSNTTNTDSKESYVPEERSQEIMDIISFWNTLSGTTTHKKDPSTDVFQTSVVLIHRLLEGQPVVHKKNGQPTKYLQEFADNEQIPEDIIYKKWTVDEIKAVLSNIDFTSLPTKTKKGLPDTLWNNFAKNGGFSLFLYQACQEYYMTSPTDEDEETYIDIVYDLGKAIHRILDQDEIVKSAHALQDFLEDTPDASIDETQQIIHWYAQNREDQYTPIITNTTEFIEKYFRLREMHTKHQNNGQQQKKNTGGSRSQGVPAQSYATPNTDILYG